MRFTLMLFAILVTIGCETMEEPREINGEVLEVRITSSTANTLGQGDAAAGAVLGALIAGPTGAVIGSAAGSDTQRTIASGQLLGCLVIVQAEDDRSVSFFTTANETSRSNMVQCSLLRKGDKFPRLMKKGNDDYRWGSNWFYGIRGTFLH